MINSINKNTEQIALSDTAPRQVKPLNIEKTKTDTERDVAEKESVKNAIEKLNEAMVNMKTEQEFVLDEDISRPIVKIINSETKEVIRQIPTEEAIRISKNIGKMLGLLLDDSI